MVQQSEADIYNLYQALYAVVPGACIFTSVSVPSDGSELDMIMPTSTISGSQQTDILNDLPGDVSVPAATVSGRPESPINDLPQDDAIRSTTISCKPGCQPDPVNDFPSDMPGDVSVSAATGPESPVNDFPQDNSIRTTTISCDPGCQPDPVNDFPNDTADDASIPPLMETNIPDSRSSSEHIPAPLTELHRDAYKLMNSEELLKEADRYFMQ